MTLNAEWLQHQRERANRNMDALQQEISEQREEGVPETMLRLLEDQRERYRGQAIAYHAMMIELEEG